MSVTIPVPRPTARILLTDSLDRLLLFQGRGEGERRAMPAWFTPGGGVAAGESLPVAASRELREETGLVVPPEELGPVVAVTTGHWRGDRTTYLATDSFFFLRVDSAEIDTSGQEEFERAMMVSHRWWTLPELRTTRERVTPFNLADLMRRLLGGDIPKEPVTLPWHGERYSSHEADAPSPTPPPRP
jgi:ADP-ribose pyrophosphatase YjhB (NUDIX family)